MSLLIFVFVSCVSNSLDLICKRRYSPSFLWWRLLFQKGEKKEREEKAIVNKPLCSSERKVEIGT